MTRSHRSESGKIRRIAVIGAGISGLGAAWLLSRSSDVVLYEARPQLGGHAQTVHVAIDGREIPVDIGFIVFNHVNYPHLSSLFSQLDVPIQPSDMSFAVSLDKGRFEFGCRNLRAALAQTENMLRPKFWQMIGDIRRFNRNILADTDANPDLSLGDFIAYRRLGKWFEQRYLLPMSGAIWSTPRNQMLRFPAQALARFFDNHGLLSFHNQHQWWTVKDGSENYVTRMAARMNAEIRPGSPIEAVWRDPHGIHVKAVGNESQTYDNVIFACHADTTLSLLQDATKEENDILAAIPYQPNRVILHTDSTLMPRRRACWSSWVYLADAEAEKEGAQAAVSYWMNSLQGISSNTPLIVTLNPPARLDENTILAEHALAHPQFDFAAIKAQQKLGAIQGRGGIFYCGAWVGMGFHEDGLASALNVAAKLGVSAPWK
ncbi:MAG: FAD-dependent oxidoreductase [Rhodobacteraceae bacterium]|nr:FAD-dependent oxidoreductase [Paracoccaceae bacterium]